MKRFEGEKSKEANKNPNKKASAIIVLAFLIISLFIFNKLFWKNEDQTNEIVLLNQEDQIAIFKIARDTLNNYFQVEKKEFNTKKISSRSNIQNKAFVTIRVGGKTRGCWSAQAENLATTIHQATINSIQDERYGGVLYEYEIPKARIDISILGEYKTIENQSIDELEKILEAGIHGIRLDHPDVSGATFLPYVQIEKNRSMKKLLERLCKKTDLPSDCTTDPKTEMKAFKVLHLIESQEGLKPIQLYRGARLINTEEINTKNVRSSLEKMGIWFLTNLNEDSALPYLYYPSNGNYPNDDNIIRQFLTNQGIFALAESLGSKKLEEAGFKHLETLISKYYKFDEEKNFAYFEHKDKIKLGATALGIIAMLESPNPKKYSENINALANFVKYMQQSNGSFQTFYKPTDFETNQRFYSGEALAAIIKLYNYSKDEKWIDFIDKSFDYYEHFLKENYTPQFVPWHTFAYFQLAIENRDQKYSDFIFWMNDRLIVEMLVTNPQYLDQLGRFYNAEHPEWGPPQSVSTEVYLESLTYAYELAKTIKDEERSKSYKEAILLATRSVLQLQWDKDSTYYLQHPERVFGAFKKTVSNNVFRIDQIGHAANALTRVLQILEGEI